MAKRDNCGVIFYPHRVVSGSRDATLRLWNVESGQCLHVLMGHMAAVRCVQYDGKRVVSGAYDYTVRVWDPETENCVHVLSGHTNRVYSLQVRTIYPASADITHNCIGQPRWLSGLRHSHVHSLMIARRSLCPEKLGSNPGQGSKGIYFSGWHGLDMSVTVTKRR